MSVSSKKTGGRQKGAKNKSTQLIREAIGDLLEYNRDNMTEWMERVARENPKDALALYSNLAEFAIPKLSRQEQQQLGKDGEKIDPVQQMLDLVHKSNNNDLPNKTE